MLVVSQLAAAGAAFLVNILASRVMDPELRGELAFALQLSYLLTVLVLMGLERPFMATQNGGFSAQYLSFVRLVRPGLALILVIAVVALLLPDGVALYAALIIGSALYVAVNVLVRGVRVAYVTSRAWKPFLMTSLGSQGIIVLGALLLVVNGIGAPQWWMLVYVLSGIIPFALLLIAMLRSRKMSTEGFVGSERELRINGMKLFPAALGNTAMVRSDRLLLPVLGTPADLGLYVTVATVMEIAVWPVQQWVDVSLRRWSKAGSLTIARMAKITLSTAALAGALSAVLGAMAYGIVLLLLPVAYHGSVSVIVPLGIASIFYAVTRVQQGFLISLGAPGTVSIVETVGWVASVSAYILLIPSQGILGAAVGSIIGYAACAVAGVVAIYRQRPRHN